MRRGKQADAAPTLSRLEQLKRKKIVPHLPPNPMPHLIGWLLEIGLTEAAGAGVGPVSWREIDAWCNRTRIDLAPWEARLIRRLSTVYVAEGRRVEAETCPPPWRGKVTAAERKAEDEELLAILG